MTSATSADDGGDDGEIGGRTYGTQSRNSALTARQNQSGDKMRVTEVRILDDNDLVKQLTDMRVWLDQHGYAPSPFTYYQLRQGMKIQVLFNVDDEAEAFVQKFGGSLIATS
jgi:hypothetical protein